MEEKEQMKRERDQAAAVLQDLDKYPVKVFGYAANGVRDITGLLSDSQYCALEDMIRGFMEDLIRDVDDQLGEE